MINYNKTIWVNGSTPALNSTNLNNIENGLDAVITGYNQLGRLYLHHIVATEINGGDAVDLYFITNSQTHLTVWDIREPEKFIKGWFSYGDTPFMILGGNNSSEGGLVLIDNDNATVNAETSYLFEWNSSSTYSVEEL